ncbi:MAG: hypothetical protein ACLTDR_05605 [Adlercreutzia equolifaciens]
MSLAYGMAYASLRDCTNAINCFEEVGGRHDQPHPHKSHMGMGNALMKLGAVRRRPAWPSREAALDESNPDPAKALLNLGVCYMALSPPGRRRGLGWRAPAVRYAAGHAQPAGQVGKSLGQAYVACGQMEEVCGACLRGGHRRTRRIGLVRLGQRRLTQRAVGAVARNVRAVEPAPPGCCSWADMSGLDVAADGTSV